MAVNDIGMGDGMEALAEASFTVPQAVAETSAMLGDELMSHIADGLDGGTLQSRSGRLANSLSLSLSSDEDGASATIQSDAPYARYQDQGFFGSEQVREHLRLQSVAFGRPMTAREVLVRAFSRQVAYPGTRFLSGPLQDMRDEIVASYRAAVIGALQP